MWVLVPRSLSECVDRARDPQPLFMGGAHSIFLVFAELGADNSVPCLLSFPGLRQGLRSVSQIPSRLPESGFRLGRLVLL